MLASPAPIPADVSAVAAFDVVVIAASLGGVAAIRTLLGNLPADFPIPIIIVQHMSARYKSHFVELLNHCSRLPVQWATAGERLAPGRVYVAPPNHHVVLSRKGVLALTQTAKVHFTRPAANPLFESVARWYGKCALCVILTGTGSDGTQGAQALKRAGGRVLVQDQETAVAWNMPSAALQAGCVDFVLSLHGLAAALVALVMVPGAAQFFAGANAAMLVKSSSTLPV